jgi:MtrB/PioB family decaheme-associated outer membrane protein
MGSFLASWLTLTLAWGAPDPQAPPTSPPAQEPAPAPIAAPAVPEVAAPAAAAAPTEHAVRRVDLGVQGPEADTNSSRFREYRAIPSGPVLPYLRLAGGTSHLYDLSAQNALQEDARYRVYVEPGPFALDASYVRIPHRFGNEARSLLERTGPGTYLIEDTLQQSFQAAIDQQYARNRAGVNFPFLNALVTPAIASQTPFDLKLQRDRGRAELRLTHDLPVDVRLTYAHEKREGTRESGTSFGFGNVVQSAEPIDYRTQDIGLSAEWTQGWGLLRGGLRFNLFNNAIPQESFDNPFRVASTTDPSAYQAPGSASVNGPAFGRIVLPPDNRSVTGSLGGVVKFGSSARLSSDASYGRWTQDEAFIPFTSNSAISTPFDMTDVRNLPVASLDGRIDIFSLASAFTYRPLRGLGITARYRRYDLDNKTPRVPFAQGYVRFDSAYSNVPRISVPYGYTSDQAVASASYDLGARLTLEGGYRFDGMDRTFRETERTTQDTLFASAVFKLADWGILRASAEKGNRDFDHYELEHSEDASFLQAVAPTNQEALRRYDQANKDTTRLSALLQLSPNDKVGVSAGYVRGKDDYKDLELGLTDALNEAFNLEVDWTPGERLTLYAFYTHEKSETNQVGRQSGATPSANPLDDWSADLSDKVDFYGGGGTVVLKPSRLDLKLVGTLQNVNGNAGLFAPPGGAAANARLATGGVQDIGAWDDTRLLTVLAELGWTVDARWRLAGGAWLEDYEVRDLNSQGLQNYVPGSFFLAPVDSDYRGYVIYARASYTW